MTVTADAADASDVGEDLASTSSHRRSGRPSTPTRPTRSANASPTCKQRFHGLDLRICYAVKANSNLAILQLMAQPAWAPTSSRGRDAAQPDGGIPAEQIVFSGVGKTEAEIDEALDAGVWRFNVESADELARCNVSPQRRRDRARRGPHQSRRRCAHPREDLHRQGREQVRRVASTRRGAGSPRRRH